MIITANVSHVIFNLVYDILFNETYFTKYPYNVKHALKASTELDSYIKRQRLPSPPQKKINFTSITILRHTTSDRYACKIN